MHDDIHDLLFHNGSILLAGDGSFYKGSYSSSYWSRYFWERRNKNLNVCLINGFSGASDKPNEYVMGMQDMLMTDYYDAGVGKTLYQHYSGENDGGIIDKFNNNLIISDYGSGGNSDFYFTNTGPTSFDASSISTSYLPDPSPAYYLEPGNYAAVGQEFSYHPFFQDPYRKNRIYNTGKGATVTQFDPVSNKFVCKFRLQDEIAHFTNSPIFLSQEAYTGPNYGIHYISWEANITGMSFSQQDKNSVYVLTRNRWEFGPHNAGSQVVKFLGPDFDDLWFDHNELRLDNPPYTPYWQLVTPNWQSMTSVSTPDIFNICLTGVETSNWDKNVIYVSCSSNSPGFPLKIVKGNTQNYPSVWEDYSTGIPSGEDIISITMDHASNDGIYACTEKGVYFRDASMNAWVPYKTNMPVIGARQMEINYKENTVRAGTFGRGIWKSQLACPSQSVKLFNNTAIPPQYFEASNIIAANSASSNISYTIFRATNSIVLNPGFISTMASTDGSFQAFIHGCTAGSGTSNYEYYRTNYAHGKDELLKEAERENKAAVFPNPTLGVFNLKFDDVSLDEDYHSDVLIYNQLSEEVYSLYRIPSTTSQVEININSQPPGIYLMRIIREGGETQTLKIIKQ